MYFTCGSEIDRKGSMSVEVIVTVVKEICAMFTHMLLMKLV